MPRRAGRKQRSFPCRRWVREPVALWAGAFIVSGSLFTMAPLALAHQGMQVSSVPLPEDSPLSVEELEEQRRYRERIAFESSTEHILALAGNESLRAPNDLEKWDLLLSPAEYLEIERRAALVEEFARAADYLHSVDLEDLFGAVWQDHEQGGDLVVALTSQSDEVEASVRGFLRSPDDVRFVVRDTSAKELRDTYGAVTRHLERGAEPSIADVIVDEPAGVLTLVVQDDSPDIQAELVALFPQNFVRVIAGSPPDVQAELRFDTFSPLRGGLAIHVSGTPNRAQCTSGFILRRSDGTQWMTTAGHCGANGTLWNQGHARTINPIALVGTGGQSDEGVIHIPAALGSNWVYLTDTTVRGMFSAQLSNEDPVGSSVCASYGNSDRIDCGIIENRFVTIQPGPGRPLLLTNHRSVSQADSRPGDSGSSYFLNNRAYGHHWGHVNNVPVYGHISALLRELTEQGQGTYTIRTD